MDTVSTTQPETQSPQPSVTPLGYVNVHKKVLQEMQRAINQVMISTNTPQAPAEPVTALPQPVAKGIPAQRWWGLVAFLLNLPAALFWLASLFYILGEEQALTRILSYLPVGGAVGVNFVLPVAALVMGAIALKRDNLGGKLFALLTIVISSVFCVGYLFWWLS